VDRERRRVGAGRNWVASFRCRITLKRKESLGCVTAYRQKSRAQRNRQKVIAPLRRKAIIAGSSPAMTTVLRASFVTIASLRAKGRRNVGRGIG
jgi:hypothetical protein